MWQRKGGISDAFGHGRLEGPVAAASPRASSAIASGAPANRRMFAPSELLKLYTFVLLALNGTGMDPLFLQWMPRYSEQGRKSRERFCLQFALRCVVQDCMSWAEKRRNVFNNLSLPTPLLTAIARSSRSRKRKRQFQRGRIIGRDDPRMRRAHYAPPVAQDTWLPFLPEAARAEWADHVTVPVAPFCFTGFAVFSATTLSGGQAYARTAAITASAGPLLVT